MKRAHSDAAAGADPSKQSRRTAPAAKVGVLALQGGFREHCDLIRACDATAVEVRTVADLEGLDGLILPGGESTAMQIVGEGGKMVRLPPGSYMAVCSQCVPLGCRWCRGSVAGVRCDGCSRGR